MPRENEGDMPLMHASLVLVAYEEYACHVRCLSSLSKIVGTTCSS
jgi:hypothetical protein